VQDKMQFGTSDATSEEQDMLQDHVLKVSVPIRATLGGTKISIQDFINLQAGDLLVLKEKSDEENLVLVKDKPMFRGVVGRREKNRAILITDHFKKDASHAVR
ncbi:FliM/FliN family flagellar motor switch protein, partial [Candidatus Neomarinimicrobiota bacterium]